MMCLFRLQTIMMESRLQVVYETNGFLEKNRDLLHADLLQLLGSCDCALPQLFAASIGEGAQKLLSPNRRVNGTESQKQSVAAKFKVYTFHYHPYFLSSISCRHLEHRCVLVTPIPALVFKVVTS